MVNNVGKEVYMSCVRVCECQRQACEKQKTKK